MKLSLTLNNKTYSVESDEGYDGSDVYELAEQFKGLLVSAGFHPSNVDSIFDIDYAWFTDEEQVENLQGHLPDSLLDKMSTDEKIQKFQANMYKQDDNK